MNVDDRGAVFEQHRRLLEGISYRMLGSMSEARDVVQDTYLKWHQVDASQLENPRAWLVTVCSRIALNHLNAARTRREQYVGEWLPEPVLDEVGSDMSHSLELNESLSLALLHVLERLTPTERAAFLLHDVFSYSFKEVAEILGKSPASCRQLASRARKQIHGNATPRFQASAEEHQQLLTGFLQAIEQPDCHMLEQLLARDVELFSDGGGKVEALPTVLRGVEGVAAFLTEIFSNCRSQGISLGFRTLSFNAALGVLVYEDGQLATAITISVSQQRIHSIYAVRNPDKLGAFSGLQ